MDVVRATPFEHGTVVWPLRPDTPLMLIVVKATFRLVPSGAAVIADEQTTLSGPLFVDDDPDRSLRYPGDFDPLKPHGECFLVGTCHPPGGPARASEVRFAVGDLEKRVAVFGDRRWDKGMLGAKVSEPVPFESMPLTWERAFGGPGTDNPFGRGAGPVDTREGPVHWLPNLEDPSQLVDSRAARPSPACFAPLHPTHPARVRLSGTCDQRWVEERFPYYPVDLDPAYFLASPSGQRSSTYWSGTETIALSHLHPEHASLTTHLPGLRPRAFVERLIDGGSEMQEVFLKCDTIVVDSDALLAHCVFRGLFAVADKAGSDIKTLFLMHEDQAAPKSLDACNDELEEQLRRVAAEEEGYASLDPADDQDARTLVLIKERAEALTTAPGSTGTLATLMLTQIASLTTVSRTASEPGEEPAPMQTVETRLSDLEAPDSAASTPDAAVLAVDQPAPPAPRATVVTSFERIGEPVPDEIEEHLDEPHHDEPREASLHERALLDYAEGRPLSGDLSGLRLPDQALDDLSAENAILTDADFSRCSLRAANLKGASLSRARLSGADLTEADLRGADLTGAHLEGATLDGAKLDDATLDRACLDRASLRGASLVKVEARRASFAEACLEEADATELDLSHGSLRFARCRGAKLVDARLAGVDATGVEMTGCDVTKLRGYDGARFDDADLRGMSGDGSRWARSSLARARFDLSSLSGSNFSSAILREASLDGCVMKKARLRFADLTGARVRRADLMSAKLEGAILSETDFEGSSLHAADLQDAILDRPRFDRADLSGTKIEGRG